VGLSRTDSLSFGRDYGQTLNLWRQSFLANRGALADQGYEERFLRLWEIYFCYCEAGFATGQLDVHQLIYQKS
jgi:cyclopropane-fatty-acyl-phospholipid synthase